MTSPILWSFDSHSTPSFELFKVDTIRIRLTWIYPGSHAIPRMVRIDSKSVKFILTKGSIPVTDAWWKGFTAKIKFRSMFLCMCVYVYVCLFDVATPFKLELWNFSIPILMWLSKRIVFQFFNIFYAELLAFSIFLKDFSVNLRAIMEKPKELFKTNESMQRQKWKHNIDKIISFTSDLKIDFWS